MSKLGDIIHTCNPNAGRGRGDRFLNFTDQLACLDCSGSVREAVSKNKVQSAVTSSLHIAMYTYMCMYPHKCYGGGRVREGGKERRGKKVHRPWEMHKMHDAVNF